MVKTSPRNPTLICPILYKDVIGPGFNIVSVCGPPPTLISLPFNGFNG